MSKLLLPTPRWWLRGLLFVLAVGLAMFSSAGWFPKLVFLASMALIFGTCYQARLNNGKFERRFVLCFVPLRRRRWSLDRFVQIETDVEGRAPLWSALIVGGMMWLMFRCADWLFPWIAGEYKLWLRAPKARVLAWQGNDEGNFQSNLELLERMTGLPVERG